MRRTEYVFVPVEADGSNAKCFIEKESGLLKTFLYVIFTCIFVHTLDIHVINSNRILRNIFLVKTEGNQQHF